MTPLPLDQIGLGWRSHWSALWWLWLLYRRPSQFREHLEPLRWRGLWTATCLTTHLVPWLFFFTLAGRVILVGEVGMPSQFDEPNLGSVLLHHAKKAGIGIATGIMVGIELFGLALAGIALHRIVVVKQSGIWLRITNGIIGGITSEIAVAITMGIASFTVGRIKLDVGAEIALVIVIAASGGIVFTTAFANGFSALAAAGVFMLGLIIGAIGVEHGNLIGCTVAATLAAGMWIKRAVYVVSQPFFVLPRLRPEWYRWHPVAWDDLCGVPFPSLDRLLAAFAETDPAAGRAEIERLIDTYPAQRTSALKARIRLIAREAGREPQLSRLLEIVNRLPTGDRGYLAEAALVGGTVFGIVEFQRQLEKERQPLFRREAARKVLDTIQQFHSRVAGFHEPLVSEFRKAAEQWMRHAEQQLREIEDEVARTPIPQAFRAGDPVNPGPEAFLKREAVLTELKREVVFNRNCPGVLLYGRRRVGKSTLIRNVNEFLPGDVRLMSISMQDPAASTSLETLLRTLANRVAVGCPLEVMQPERVSDLTSFFEGLTRTQAHLEDISHRLIIAIDEYEVLDDKIGAGVFSLDLLAMFRESIQTHRRITWLFAGSHSIDELTHAPWPSYFVSLRTVEVPLFTQEETRMLLTDPLQHSPLWRGTERPKFPDEFWGPGGLDRIHAQTAGWPHLVQLLAELCVDFANDRNVRQISPALFEEVLAKAIVRGDSVLRLLLQTECKLPGEWDYLSNFRHRDTQPPPDDEEVARSLKRRLLVVDTNDEWRLHVPLMQLWLRVRG